MLDMGVRGYVVTSCSLGEVVGAIRLVNAGGTFVPASSLRGTQQLTIADGSKSAQKGASLTPRQTAVLKALREGKPNKIIAYELCMAESTVKVHVRTMMKKFRATNRTQLAFLAGRQQSTNAMAEKDQNSWHGGRGRVGEPESQGSRQAAA
jgi:DNA-binding NarL/FixJ family response regulator